MAKFIYKVKDDQGRVKTGTLDVANKKEAERQLKAKGFVIQDLHPMPESKIGPGRQATGQAEAAPRQPQNASMVIPPLSLPTRSNPPSGKIQSPAFLGRDPKADSGLTLPLEGSKASAPLTIQPREPAPPAPAQEPRGSSGPSWSPTPPPPVPSSPTLPPLSSSPGEGWPPAAPPPPPPPPSTSGGWPALAPTQQGWPAPSPPAPPPPPAQQGWPPAAPQERGWPASAPAAPPPLEPSWPPTAQAASPPPAAPLAQPPLAQAAPPQQGWPPAAPLEQSWPPSAPPPLQQGWPPAAPLEQSWPPSAQAAPPPPATPLAQNWPPAHTSQPVAPLDAPAPPALPPLGPRAESRPVESSYASRIDLSVPPPKIDLSLPPPPIEPLTRPEPPPPPPPPPPPSPAPSLRPKIDLAAPPPALQPPAPEPPPKLEPALKLEPRTAASSWPPSPPEPAPGLAKLELARVPKRDAQPPARPLPEPEPDEPEEPDDWLDEPVLETPMSSSRVEEEPVEVIDSWSKVLPPRSPSKKSDSQGPAPARRRRAEYDSYTDHLDDDQDQLARRKKGSVAGCFLLLLFLGTLVSGGSFFLFGHEIADWLEVHGYLQYLPDWLRLHLP